MKNIFDQLGELVKVLTDKADTSMDNAVAYAYTDSAKLLTEIIETVQASILAEDEFKLSEQMRKFDINHNNYSEILRRGHIGIPDDSHAHISEFTLGNKTATEVFDALSDSYKTSVLSHLAADKEMNEQLTAYRHGFHFITHTKGHDGISPNGKVYEVKNKKYKKKDKRAALDIVFDRLSPATLRKLEEGKPEIIFNITDGHRVIVEMRINMSQKLLKIYEEKVNSLKTSKTSGFAIPFKDYQEDILEVTYIHEDIESYHIQQQVLTYLKQLQTVIA